MNRRLLALAVLVALFAAPAGAHRGAYGVAIRAVTVNRDRSVTIAWNLESANVANARISVDGAIVRSGSDRATTFTTAPLRGGVHIVTVEAREYFETLTASGPSCVVSGGHWICARDWRSSMSVTVPFETFCVVPHVVGLQLAVARTRIRNARCATGTVERLRSKRQAGTVLTQRPTESGRQLADGTAIALVVSSGRN